MQAINTAMRAQYTGWGIEGLCDFRKTPGYETYNGTSVGSFSDGVHRNDLGYQLMARDVRDSLKALIAPLGVPVPNYLFPFEGGATTPAPGTETITISSIDVIDDYITIDSVTVL
jgi:hypothetical protein